MCELKKVRELNKQKGPCLGGGREKPNLEGRKSHTQIVESGNGQNILKGIKKKNKPKALKEESINKMKKETIGQKMMQGKNQKQG